jgi:ABC-type Fe3+/spermidine/putrescine transport system ATPase subunit
VILSLIKLENVTKRFDDITALDRVSFSVEDGEYLCILGQTGAGKTTLLRVIAGLLDPDDGEIYIEDKIVNDVPPEERDTVYMFQQFALFPHMNVWQNVSFGPEIKGWNKNRVKEVSGEILDMVRLADRWDALPDELSGGMQQRVALARGIATGARILLLDEPFGALDVRLRVNLRFQLRKLVKDQKLTVIHVTHDQEEALTIADRVAVLRKGRIQQVGTPQEVYTRPRSIFVTNFVGGANFIEGTIVHVHDYGSTIEIRGGLRINVSDKYHPIGNRVVVAIRHENVILNSDKSLENNLNGIVDSISFIGSFTECRIKLENGNILTSKSLTSIIKPCNIRDKVSVSFLPDNSLVFSYPPSGLLTEIEAI